MARMRKRKSNVLAALLIYIIVSDAVAVPQAAFADTSRHLGGMKRRDALNPQSFLQIENSGGSSSSQESSSPSSQDSSSSDSSSGGGGDQSSSSGSIDSSSTSLGLDQSSGNGRDFSSSTQGTGEGGGALQSSSSNTASMDSSEGSVGSSNAEGRSSLENALQINGLGDSSLSSVEMSTSVNSLSTEQSSEFPKSNVYEWSSLIAGIFFGLRMKSALDDRKLKKLRAAEQKFLDEAAKMDQEGTDGSNDGGNGEETVGEGDESDENTNEEGNSNENVIEGGKPKEAASVDEAATVSLEQDDLDAALDGDDSEDKDLEVARIIHAVGEEYKSMLREKWAAGEKSVHDENISGEGRSEVDVDENVFASTGDDESASAAHRVAVTDLATSPSQDQNGNTEEEDVKSETPVDGANAAAAAAESDDFNADIKPSALRQTAKQQDAEKQEEKSGEDDEDFKLSDFVVNDDS